MKTKSAKVLPKTAGEIANGGVYVQRVRCGKANCKCAGKGERHTAFYFFTRRNNKLFKLYVRKAEIARFSNIVDQATFERSQNRETVKTSTEVLTQFSAFLKEKDSLIKTLRKLKYEESKIKNKTQRPLK